MKIVAVDNFASEAVADLLVAENITNKSYAEVMVKALNDRYSGENAARHYQVWEDEMKLSRGVEDLI